MRTLYISKTAFICFIIYYALLFLSSLIYIIIYFYLGNIAYCDVYLIASLSSLLGSSIYYTRKLYKDCFNDGKISSEKDFFKQIATIIYFITRPFFAIAFAIIIIIGLKAGFVVIATAQNEINSTNFIYTCVFLSFIGGFNVGKLIAKFENFELHK